MTPPPLSRLQVTLVPFWVMQKRAHVAAKAATGTGFNLINMVATKRAPNDASEPVTFTCTFR